MAGEIQFTLDKYNKLKKAYEKARLEKRESFLLEGHEMSTSYARYLLEFLKNKFEN